MNSTTCHLFAVENCKRGFLGREIFPEAWSQEAFRNEGDKLEIVARNEAEKNSSC